MKVLVNELGMLLRLLRRIVYNRISCTLQWECVSQYPQY